MPSGDKTGPEGLGPRTGRGFGYCSGYDSPGYTKGFGRGRRFFGRGFRMRFRPFNVEDEQKLLEADLSNLKEEMAVVEKRLKELKK